MNKLLIILGIVVCVNSFALNNNCPDPKEVANSIKNSWTADHDGGWHSIVRIDTGSSGLMWFEGTVYAKFDPRNENNLKLSLVPSNGAGCTYNIENDKIFGDYYRSTKDFTMFIEADDLS